MFCVVKSSLNELRVLVNARFASKEPWQIAAITATSLLSFMWLHDLLTADEGIFRLGITSITSL